MPRDMFGDIVEPSIKVGSKKWYTVPLSILVHTVIIGAVVIIPLMAADVLPTPPGDDGVRRGAATATTAAASAAAAPGGCRAEAGAGSESGRGAGRGAEGNQARDRDRERQ